MRELLAGWGMNYPHQTYPHFSGCDCPDCDRRMCDMLMEGARKAQERIDEYKAQRAAEVAAGTRYWRRRNRYEREMINRQIRRLKSNSPHLDAFLVHNQRKEKTH